MKMSKIGTSYNAEVKWDGNSKTFVPAMEKLRSTASANDCLTLALPVTDPNHRPMPIWSLGDKMTMNDYRFLRRTDTGLLDFELPRLNSKGLPIQREEAVEMFERWKDSVQWIQKRDEFDALLETYEKDKKSFLVIAEGSLTPTALKKVIVPFERRDPVATLAALYVAGQPAVAANLRIANQNLLTLKWIPGESLSDFKTSLEDVGRQLVASGGREPEDSQCRSLIEQAVLDTNIPAYATAVQVLNSTDVVSLEKWWVDLMAVEQSANASGKKAWGKANPPKAAGAKQRAHAAADEKDEKGAYERPRGCRICRGDHIAKFCDSTLAVKCPKCKWVRPKSEPKCTMDGCVRKGKEKAKLALRDRDSDDDCAPTQEERIVALVAKSMEKTVSKMGKKIEKNIGKRLERLESRGAERDTDDSDDDEN
jgi:hypothetical protein